MAFEKGKSGNINGRPKGSQNNVSSEVKEKLAKFVDVNFSTFQKEFALLKPEIKVKLYLEAAKMVIPKPKDLEVDEDTFHKRDELIVRLFNLDQKKD